MPKHETFPKETPFARFAVPCIIMLIGLLVVIGTLFSSCDTNLVSLQKKSSPPTPTNTLTRVMPTETRATSPSVVVQSTPLSDLAQFETGVVAPSWSPAGYTTYTPTLKSMKSATNARWVELPIYLVQDTVGSSTISLSTTSSPTPAALSAGIMQAHALGLRVFVIPLLGVKTPGKWAGAVHPTDIHAWFASYWLAYQPFMEVAEMDSADQVAIGTEESWLQSNASNDEWNNLIEEVSTVFHGQITYDTNWSDITLPLPNWFHNQSLYTIGVSEYIELINTFTYLDPASLPARWASMIRPTLDNFSHTLGKPIILSELGYRNSRDALYRPYDATTKARPAPEEQAGAYNAALANISGDHEILGVFAWGWTATGLFDIKGMPAASTIKQFYSQM